MNEPYVVSCVDGFPIQGGPAVVRCTGNSTWDGPPGSCALIALSLLAGLARVGYDLSLPAVKLPARGEVAGTILEPPRRWGRSRNRLP